MTSEHQITHGSGEGYEKRDVNVRMTLLVAIIIVVFIGVCLVYLSDQFTRDKEEMVYDMVLKPQSVTLRELRASETQTLTSYKLLDPAKGIYQIPIERAMQLMADEAYRQRTGQDSPQK